MEILEDDYNIEEKYNSEVEEEEMDNAKDHKWGLYYSKEKKFWEDTILENLIYKSQISSKYKKNTFQIYERKHKDIINPFKM